MKMIKLSTLCYIRNTKENTTLMIHRVKKVNDMHEGKWNGIGGKFENGETPEECALREVREETGLTAVNPLLKGFLTFPKFTDDDWYVFVFLIKEFTGKIINSNEGNLEWVKTSEILNLNLWEGDKYFIPYLDKDGFFTGKFIYENNELVSHSINSYSR